MPKRCFWSPLHVYALADMNELGRNPARITLALGTFARQHAGRRIRIVTESL
jgi:hypothetical protein